MEQTALTVLLGDDGDVALDAMCCCSIRMRKNTLPTRWTENFTIIRHRTAKYTCLRRERISIPGDWKKPKNGRHRSCRLTRKKVLDILAH